MENNDIFFLKEGGEMGNLIRNFDWAHSSLGPIHSWPSALTTNLHHVLHADFPMFLLWGVDSLCFYNDLYRPRLGSYGRHPAVGKHAREIWPESWPAMAELIDRVYTSGRTHLDENQLLRSYQNGSLQNQYWTYSYSPAHGNDDAIAGVVVACIETTLAVMARNKIEEEVQERTRELKIGKDKATEANKYLQDIINSFKQPLQVLEPVFENGKIIDFRFKLTNTAYAAYANTSPQLIQNKRVSEIFPGYLMTTSFTNVVKTFESGVPDTWDIHYDQDGLDLHNEMTALKLGDDVILHFADLTSAKQLELERLRKMEELELSNKNLEAFAHVVSHDLKEPLRKIRIYTSRLNDDLRERLNDFNQEPLKKIDMAAERMAVFIDDLLLYSTFHQLPPEKEQVNLNELLQRVVEDLDMIVQEKKATITVENMPVVKGYSYQLRQLFQNLISNALKYTAADVAPVITITCQNQLENGKLFYHIEVKDNGIGFEQKFADQIFNLFTRLHGNSRYSGSGIGLSIVKKIVDNHQGIIKAESAPGHGSTFIILFSAEGMR